MGQIRSSSTFPIAIRKTILFWFKVDFKAYDHIGKHCQPFVSFRGDTLESHNNL